MTPQQFVNRSHSSTSSERQAYQQHFLDLCYLAGHPIPVGLDPTDPFTLRRDQQSGGQGWADVWYRGHFAIEYKGPHSNIRRTANSSVP